jgi:hypothetical protein
VGQLVDQKRQASDRQLRGGEPRQSQRRSAERSNEPAPPYPMISAAMVVAHSSAWGSHWALADVGVLRRLHRWIARGTRFPYRCAPRDARWSVERQAGEFGVEIGEYRGVVRVPRRAFQRLSTEEAELGEDTMGLAMIQRSFAELWSAGGTWQP